MTQPTPKFIQITSAAEHVSGSHFHVGNTYVYGLTAEGDVYVYFAPHKASYPGSVNQAGEWVKLENGVMPN